MPFIPNEMVADIQNLAIVRKLQLEKELKETISELNDANVSVGI
jgi:hypothetical protein